MDEKKFSGDFCIFSLAAELGLIDFIQDELANDSNYDAFSISPRPAQNKEKEFSELT